MDMAGQVVRCALTVAASYYMMAAAIVVAHCIFDEGIAWNARKRLLLFFACILDEMISMFLPERTAATILIFFFYFFVIAYGCHGKYLSRILKVFGIVLYMVICVMMVCDIGGHYMLRGYSVLEDHGDGLGYIVVSLLIFLPLYYYMISQYFKKKIYISFRKREKVFLICNLIYVFGFYAMIFFSEEAGHSMEKVLQMAMAAVMIIFVLGLPAYLFQNRARAFYRDRNDYQEAFMQAELAYFQQYKESQQETKHFRHDMKNHLSCLNIMLGEEKNDEAREYLESLLHQVMSLSPEIVTGDEMLDCIFSSKWNLMKKENINFEIDGVLDGPVLLHGDCKYGAGGCGLRKIVRGGKVIYF